MELTELDKGIIRALQGSIPMDTLNPYAAIAGQLGIEEQALLERLRQWREQGVIRRMGAVLKHQKVGKVFNAMSVWCAPTPELTKTLAEVLMSFKQVTHCYERPVFPEWRFNVFGMMHCENREECEAIASEIAKRSGVSDYELLLSTKEYKKESLEYF